MPDSVRRSSAESDGGGGACGPEQLGALREDWLFVAFNRRVPPRTILQAQTLERRGARVRIISMDDSGRAPTDPRTMPPIRLTLSDRIGRAGLTVVAAVIAYPEFLVRVARRLRKAAGPQSAVQLTHPFMLVLAPFLLRRGTRVFYDVFEFHEIEFAGGRLPRVGLVAGAVCRALERLVVPRLDGVLCVTSRDQWLVRRLGRLNPAVFELPNYGSRDYANSALPPAGAASDTIVAFVGELTEASGLTVFPEIVRRVTEVRSHTRFLILGDVQGNLSPIEWLRTNGIDNQCTYLPWTRADAIHAQLASADIGIVLSQNVHIHRFVELGNGRKLFDYLAAGLPVVVPDFSEAWRPVEEERFGVRVDTGDPDAVAKAICSVLDDDERRQHMSAAGRRAFLERYNWEAVEPYVLSLYAGNGGGDRLGRSLSRSSVHRDV